MKININTERLNANLVKSAAVNKNIKNINPQPVELSAEGVRNNAGNRTIIDAILISQIAQGYFQKAIQLSSELKNIAIDAVTTGIIKEKELTGSINSIRSSLAEIQGYSLQTAENSTAVYMFTGLQAKNTLPEEEISSLQEIAKSILNETGTDLKRIDRINESLTNKASDLGQIFKQLKGSMAGEGTILLDTLEENKTELIRNTVNRIEDSSEAALKAQGNIKRENLNNLLSI